MLITIIPIHKFSGSRWVPLFRQLSDLDDDLFALIAARRRGDRLATGENVLDDLLAATHEDGSPLDALQVRDPLITILIAGHDATALALAWALAEMVPRADVVDRLTDELKRVTGGHLRPRPSTCPPWNTSMRRFARACGKARWCPSLCGRR